MPGSSQPKKSAGLKQGARVPWPQPARVFPKKKKIKNLNEKRILQVFYLFQLFPDDVRQQAWTEAGKMEPRLQARSLTSGGMKAHRLLL
jgi:hypothetical protein